MNKRHRKHSGQKDLGAIKARERKAFVVRMRIICEKMVGPGYFELFPLRLVNQMYAGRYPAFKVVIANPKGLSEHDALIFRQSFFRILGMAKVETLTGESIAYSWYLRDVLLLVHYAELGVVGGFSGSASLLKAFEPYFRGSQWYQTYQERTIKFLTFALMHMHDFYKGYLDADIGQLPFQDHRGRNCIRLFRIQPQIIHINIDGIRRPISRMGWYDAKHGTNWTATTAGRLGFETADDTTLLPVYIQQHALNRFQERTMLPSGLVIGYLSNLFTNGLPIYHRTKDHSLVEFFVDKYKIGYFVISVQQNSLLVHTFLFLTNDGTPEGKRLAKLTHLKLLDKQYLGIDQIDAFMQYNIIGDTALRNLFINAGCGSLLSYVDEAFPKDLLPLESTAFLHKYLGNVAALSRNTKLSLTQT